MTGAAAPPALLDAFDVPDIRAGVQVSTPGPPPTNVTVSQGGDPVVLWDRLVGRSPAFQSRLEVSRAAGDGSWTAPESARERAIDGWPLAVGRRGRRRRGGLGAVRVSGDRRPQDPRRGAAGMTDRVASGG